MQDPKGIASTSTPDWTHRLAGPPVAAGDRWVQGDWLTLTWGWCPPVPVQFVSENVKENLHLLWKGEKGLLHNAFELDYFLKSSKNFPHTVIRDHSCCWTAWGLRLHWFAFFISANRNGRFVDSQGHNSLGCCVDNLGNKFWALLTKLNCSC